MTAEAVQVRIHIDKEGVLLPADLLEQRLLSFTFQDVESGADRAVLRFANDDLSLFDRAELAASSVLHLSWGTSRQMSAPRRVSIEKLKGFTVLSVEGRSLAVRYDRIQRTVLFRSNTASDVVREVAAGLGYTGSTLDVQTTTARLDSNQAAETDAAFLRRLADEHSFEFWIDDAGLHWREPARFLTPSHVFVWREGKGGVLSVSVESNIARRVGRVTVRGRDPMTRSTIEASATNESVDRDVVGEVIDRIDPETGETTEELLDATSTSRSTAASSQAEAAPEAEARYRQAGREAVKLKLRVVGDATLRARSIVVVKNISRALSGNYYLNEARHSISSAGYVCDLKLSRDGTGRMAEWVAQDLAGTRNEQSLGTSNPEA